MVVFLSLFLLNIFDYSEINIRIMDWVLVSLVISSLLLTLYDTLPKILRQLIRIIQKIYKKRSFKRGEKRIKTVNDYNLKEINQSFLGIEMLKMKRNNLII